ncbi:hypothetical protein BDZ91DRAFT_786816 [Kalaharituber pfeilii]|nr:hypothetical protein BDZ91DRAFT_786816 [Kalaharituber pfeilii]
MYISLASWAIPTGGELGAGPRSVVDGKEYTYWMVRTVKTTQQEETGENAIPGTYREKQPLPAIFGDQPVGVSVFVHLVGSYRENIRIQEFASHGQDPSTQVIRSKELPRYSVSFLNFFGDLFKDLILATIQINLPDSNNAPKNEKSKKKRQLNFLKIEIGEPNGVVKCPSEKKGAAKASFQGSEVLAIA